MSVLKQIWILRHARVRGCCECPEFGLVERSRRLPSPKSRVWKSQRLQSPKSRVLKRGGRTVTAITQKQSLEAWRRHRQSGGGQQDWHYQKARRGSGDGHRDFHQPRAESGSMAAPRRSGGGHRDFHHPKAEYGSMAAVTKTAITQKQSLRGHAWVRRYLQASRARSETPLCLGARMSRASIFTVPGCEDVAGLRFRQAWVR